MELRDLAEFLAELDIRDLSLTVREAARLHVLDSLAAKIAGRGSDVDRALGQMEGSGPAWEALIGAALAHRHEVDDIFDEALLCIGGMVVSTAMALGRSRRASGAEVLAAVIAGYEVMGRVGLALGSAPLLKIGWWPTAVCGTFGAAAVAGRLLRLDGMTMANALALAGLNSGGITAGEEGSVGRNLLYGNVARAGMLAAEAAAAGLVGPQQLLTMARGLGSAYGLKPNLAQLVDGLGEQFIISRTSLKPYASARHLHAAVEMALDWRANGLDAAEIEEVVIEVPAESCFVDRPPGEALSLAPAGSAQWVLALALVKGHVLPTDFAPEALTLAPIADLARRTHVRITAPGARQQLSAALEVRAAGRNLRRELNMPKGGPERPLSAQEVGEKATALTASSLGHNAARLVELATNIEELSSVEELASL